MIFVYAVNSQNASVWHEIVQKMEMEGHKAFYVADTDRSEYLDTFQGMHTYFPPLEDDSNKLYRDLSEYYRGLSLSARTYPALYSKQESTPLWAATIAAGYDERHLARNSANYHPRENGAIYEATFRAAMASDPDWILITSFNEWWENTYIEPSEAYGWKYIDLTTLYSSEFKGVSYLPSLQISRTATVKGQQGNLSVVIVDIGNGSAIGVTAKDYLPSGTANAESVDRLLPGEEAHYSMPFDISSGQVSLQFPPGEITYRDAYAGSYHVQTKPMLEYYLAVVSLYGSPMGAGWYEANGIASLSVSPASVSMSGILGLLGAEYIFDGWTGDLTGNSANATIVMDGPKTVTATWRTDYTQAYAIVGILIVLALLAGALIKKRRPERVTNKPEIAGKAEKETQFCMNCGAKLPPESKFCNKCGSAQSVHLER